MIKNSINLMDGKKYSKEDIKVVLSKALYDDQKIEFLFEEFVRTEDGEYKIPDDYKFYMFNGQIGCIQVINRLSNTTGFTSWYDENWNLLPNLTTNYPEGKVQPIPKCLQEMIDYAGKLSKSYEIFVRVDFYATDKGAVFGEFTPTPG
ncbi:MAG: ATP-grasp fold amidoligase family protein [Segetibacter sp.]